MQIRIGDAVVQLNDRDYSALASSIEHAKAHAKRLSADLVEGRRDVESLTEAEHSLMGMAAFAKLLAAENDILKGRR